MPILAEVISRIESQYNKGIKSDESRLRPRHVYHVLISKAAKILEERLNKLQKIGDYLLTPIPCVKLIQVPAHTCCKLDLEGCYLWRTECKLPAPITSRSRHIIESVTSVDGLLRFTETSWANRKYTKHEEFTGNAPRYFLHGEYMYVINNHLPKKKTPIKYITFKGLWYDPIKALQQCTDCDFAEDECTSIFDMNFNLIGKDYEAVIALTLEELVILYSKNREDQTNDAADSRRSEAK